MKKIIVILFLTFSVNTFSVETALKCDDNKYWADEAFAYWVLDTKEKKIQEMSSFYKTSDGTFGGLKKGDRYTYNIQINDTTYKWSSYTSNFLTGESRILHDMYYLNRATLLMQIWNYSNDNGMKGSVDHTCEIISREDLNKEHKVYLDGVKITNEKREREEQEELKKNKI